MAAIEFVSGHLLDFSYRESWIILFVLLLSVLNLQQLTQHIGPLWKSAAVAPARPFVALSSAYGMLWQLLMLAMAVTGYALHAYPRLAPVFGGGRPSQVIMFVAPSSIVTARSSGIATTGSGRSELVTLTFEDATNYYVESHAGSKQYTTRIRKEDVTMVLHPVSSH